MCCLYRSNDRKETIESFAFRVFNQWKIGRKGKDNGLLLVVAINDRNVRFEVGYGYEEH
ncbi:TPM domain-containing protein [Proteus mirabilis]